MKWKRNKFYFKKIAATGFIILLTISSCFTALASQIKESNLNTLKSLDEYEYGEVKYIEVSFNFSNPEITLYNNSQTEYIVVRVNETNHNMVQPGEPVLPVNFSVFKFPFGTKILDVRYRHSPPEVIDLPGKLSFGKCSSDSIYSPLLRINGMDEDVYNSSNPYPTDWVYYHKGGGLSYGNHTTFLVLRVYPVRYFPVVDQLQFIKTITVNISYIEPAEPVLKDTSCYDLLILTPSKFTNSLKPLVYHKNKHFVRTKVVTLDEVYDKMYWHGRDKPEKIKYFIKNAVENWGVKYVLLVGGIRGQTSFWDTPVRYSHVVPLEEQEYAEKSFLSDLYYADIYDSEGNFSSWDSNNDNIFSTWNESYKEEMDLYPDVYLGRLPCRNLFEVKIMVKKIINYEKRKLTDEKWFNNLLLVAGDSYNDTNHYNEGELISELAIEKMPGFTPVRVYAREGEDINRKTVNKALDQGAGFAYFCGHGNPMSWSTHYPPNGTKWVTGYKVSDMVFLRNHDKLPIVVVGGCHNGQFDVTMFNIIKGIKKDGLHYFSNKKGNLGEFWYGEWVPNCWSWWLTSKPNGGAIATIANTGLGTHGDGDQDNNSIPDYLEVLDGWLELRFLELYGIEHKDILGENHGQTLTEYLHKFLGDNAKMDVKMVQQWELFGDPSLKIGGYNQTTSAVKFNVSIIKN